MNIINSFLHSIFYGDIVKPKPEEIWHFRLKKGNPFIDKNDSCIVLDVKKGWVKYSYARNWKEGDKFYTAEIETFNRIFTKD